MEHISLEKTILAALAALMLTTASASAASSTAQHIISPAAAKDQLNTIAKAEKLWKDEFVTHWNPGETAEPEPIVCVPSTPLARISPSPISTAMGGWNCSSVTPPC